MSLDLREIVEIQEVYNYLEVNRKLKEGWVYLGQAPTNPPIDSSINPIVYSIGKLK